MRSTLALCACMYPGKRWLLDRTGYAGHGGGQRLRWCCSRGVVSLVTNRKAFAEGQQIRRVTLEMCAAKCVESSSCRSFEVRVCVSTTIAVVSSEHLSIGLIHRPHSLHCHPQYRPTKRLCQHRSKAGAVGGVIFNKKAKKQGWLLYDRLAPQHCRRVVER